jgi:hypothetical protein
MQANYYLCTLISLSIYVKYSSQQYMVLCMMGHIYNSNYSGGRGRKIMAQSHARQKLDGARNKEKKQVCVESTCEGS